MEALSLFQTWREPLPLQTPSNSLARTATAASSQPLPPPASAWNTNTLATDGPLRVVSTAPVSLSVGRPAGAGCAPPSACLALSWPSDHIGWRLQSQTNSLSTGLSTNWFDVPNSIGTNQMTFTLNPAAGSVFYRLLFRSQLDRTRRKEWPPSSRLASGSENSSSPPAASNCSNTSY